MVQHAWVHPRSAAGVRRSRTSRELKSSPAVRDATSVRAHQHAAGAPRSLRRHRPTSQKGSSTIGSSTDGGEPAAPAAHPALAQEAQLALTLRLVCGLPTPDVARALLVPEQTMAARITRAKKKISAARIPYRVPRPAELPDRLTAVLGVIHLLFTAGHTAPSGPALMRTDLADRALHMTRALHDLMPDEPEVRGLLALLPVTDARRATRTGADGRLLRLEEQDRSLWDRTALAEAHELIMAGLRGGRAGRYLLQAAIASLYTEAPTYEETDWPQIVALYDRLLSLWPSPVVALNRTVPVSMAHGPAVALAQAEALEKDGRLSRYQYLPAVKADLLQCLGRTDEAVAAYRQATELTGNEAERAFLTVRLTRHRTSPT
ncbi:RNA polymerase sigma factor [Streptomyces sp. NPDC048720]|uniref:RNA polymerase sigma factor n=1 Tax=Streptomyces sp. NPDC048720 TaxID=3365588 RepID=UPI0037205C7E